MKCFGLNLKAHRSSEFWVDEKLLPVLTFWFKYLGWISHCLCLLKCPTFYFCMIYLNHWEVDFFVLYNTVFNALRKTQN